MPVINCEVRYGGMIAHLAGDYDDTIPVQAWNAALKETWNAIGWHFYRNFVAKHFTKAGGDEYRNENATLDSGPVYQARSGEGESGKQFWQSYNGRKQKTYGQQIAMVFSGNTRDGAKRATIDATRHGVDIRLPGCVHLNYYKPRQKEYGPHAGEPPLDLRGDLLAISRREAEEVRAMHEQLMVSKFTGAQLGWYGAQHTAFNQAQDPRR